MNIVLAQERSEAFVEGLVVVWEASVRATHDFLTEEDIQRLRPYVAEAIAGIPILAYAAEGGNPGDQVLGFMGLADEMIEMLFLAPEARGQGLGRQFITLAETMFGATKVDVNEHNTQGVGFYTHMGFVVKERSALDPYGNPFPILHLEKEQ